MNKENEIEKNILDGAWKTYYKELQEAEDREAVDKIKEIKKLLKEIERRQESTIR